VRGQIDENQSMQRSAAVQGRIKALPATKAGRYHGEISYQYDHIPFEIHGVRRVMELKCLLLADENEDVYNRF
jgi:hypothetical protein